MGDIEHSFQFFGYLQKGYIFEAEGAVCHNTLKLLAKGLYVFCGFQKIAAPVDCRRRILDHQLCAGDGLWNNSLAYYVIDTVIIVVLFLVIPKIEIGKSLSVKVLGRKYTCTGNFSRFITIINLLKVLIVKSLHCGLCRKGFRHGFHCLVIHIDTGILCLDCVHSQGEYDG